jgi:hypothetical protein
VGPFRSLAAFAWLAWLAAALVSAARPGRSTRLTVLAATLLTAAVVPVAAGTGTDRPPVLVLLPQVALGVVALFVPSRPSLLSRLAPVSGMVVAALLVAAFPPAPHYSWAYRWYAPDLLPATGLVLLLAGLVAAGGYAVRRDDRGFWAVLLLLPPAAMLGTVAVSTGLSGQAGSEWGDLAGTAAVLAVLTVAATPVAIAVRGRVARGRPAAIGADVGPAA